MINMTISGKKDETICFVAEYTFFHELHYLDVSFYPV